MGEMADYDLEQMYIDDEWSCYGDCENCPRLGYSCDGDSCMGPPRYRVTPLSKGIGCMKVAQRRIEAQVAWVKRHGK